MINRTKFDFGRKNTESTNKVINSLFLRVSSTYEYNKINRFRPVLSGLSFVRFKTNMMNGKTYTFITDKNFFNK